MNNMQQGCQIEVNPLGWINNPLKGFLLFLRNNDVHNINTGLDLNRGVVNNEPL